MAFRNIATCVSSALNMAIPVLWFTIYFENYKDISHCHLATINVQSALKISPTK